MPEETPSIKSSFWNITASNLLTIAVLLAYWYVAQTLCIRDINACYARLNNCTREKFPQFIPSINTSDFTSINTSNFTSLNLTLGVTK